MSEVQECSYQKNSREIRIRRKIGIVSVVAIIVFACIFAIFTALNIFDKIAIIVLSGTLLVGIVWALLLFGERSYKGKDEYYPFFVRSVQWLKLNSLWMIVYYWLISVSFFAPAFLSAIAVSGIDADLHRIVIYSFVSILGTFLGFVLNPKSQAYGFRRAYELLEKKLNLMEDNNNVEEGRRVLSKAMAAGERFITHATYGTFDADLDHKNDC